MGKLGKSILGLLLVICLVVWDSGSTVVLAQTQSIEPALTYQYQTSTAEENLPFLYAAYTVAWGIFFVYIFFLSRRQKRMHDELKLIRSLIEEKSDKSTNEKQRNKSN